MIQTCAATLRRAPFDERGAFRSVVNLDGLRPVPVINPGGDRAQEFIFITGLRIHDARCILNDDPPRPRARPLFKDCVAFYRVLQAGDEGLLSFFMIAG